MTAVVSIDRIKAVVAADFSVAVRELEAFQRHAPVVLPRQVAMALSYQLTQNSSAVIGRLFGHRDHTTVIHARQKVARLRTSDRDFDDRIRRLEEVLTPHSPPASEHQLTFLLGPLFDLTNLEGARQ